MNSACKSSLKIDKSGYKKASDSTMAQNFLLAAEQLCKKDADLREFLSSVKTLKLEESHKPLIKSNKATVTFGFSDKTENLYLWVHQNLVSSL